MITFTPGTKRSELSTATNRGLDEMHKAIEVNEIRTAFFIETRCPRCGCTLISNGTDVWCSNVQPACAFGLDYDVPVESLSEACEYERNQPNIFWSDEDACWIAQSRQYKHVSAHGDSYEEAQRELGIVLEAIEQPDATGVSVLGDAQVSEAVNLWRNMDPQERRQLAERMAAHDQGEAFDFSEMIVAAVFPAPAPMRDDAARHARIRARMLRSIMTVEERDMLQFAIETSSEWGDDDDTYDMLTR